MASITYYELSNYNGGILLPHTFNLDGVSEDEHKLEISEWLIELSIKTGELCEEWIICDAEDVPREFLGTWSIDSAYFELMEAINDSCYDAGVFYAASVLGIPLDKVEDAYYGEYASDETLAEDYADSTGMLDSIPENLQLYFDFEMFGRDLAMDFSEHAGHYFHSNW